MEKLLELIKAASNSSSASSDYRDVSVEMNGGIPIYFIGDVECTATQAVDRLTELGL